MKVFRIAAVMALLTAPAYAQMNPNINLVPEIQHKSPEEKEQEAAQQKAYKESLRKIPDAKASSDPWGNVQRGRSQDISPCEAADQNRQHRELRPKWLNEEANADEARARTRLWTRAASLISCCSCFELAPQGGP